VSSALDLERVVGMSRSLSSDVDFVSRNSDIRRWHMAKPRPLKWCMLVSQRIFIDCRGVEQLLEKGNWRYLFAPVTSTVKVSPVSIS
jgi:hypothetical protein